MPVGDEDRNPGKRDLGGRQGGKLGYTQTKCKEQSKKPPKKTKDTRASDLRSELVCLPGLSRLPRCCDAHWRILRWCGEFVIEEGYSRLILEVPMPHSARAITQ
ncbi:hypothetical protein KM043_011821 [Ampulex compressa]|nr:hypothetical protein KM043_011821 [Ampulex compressa]